MKYIGEVSNFICTDLQSEAKKVFNLYRYVSTEDRFLSQDNN